MRYQRFLISLWPVLRIRDVYPAPGSDPIAESRIQSQKDTGSASKNFNHAGSRGQKSTRSRIPDLSPQHCLWPTEACGKKMPHIDLCALLSAANNCRSSYRIGNGRNFPEIPVLLPLMKTYRSDITSSQIFLDGNFKHYRISF